MDWIEVKQNFSHLRDIPFPVLAKGGCGILLGVGLPQLTSCLEEVLPKESGGGVRHGPVARKGPLGWSCVGPINPGEQHYKESEIHVTFFTSMASIKAGDRLACKGKVDSMTLFHSRIPHGMVEDSRNCVTNRILTGSRMLSSGGILLNSKPRRFKSIQKPKPEFHAKKSQPKQSCKKKSERVKKEECQHNERKMQVCFGIAFKIF